MKARMFKIALIAVGALLTLDTLLLRSVSNGNLGTYIPALMGIPLLLIGIFFGPLSQWAAAGAGKAVKIVLISFYCAATLFFLCMGLFLRSQGGRPIKKADALIVLGCGVRGERVSLTLRYRLDKALEYLDAYPDALVVVSGGQGDGEDIPEALAMQRYLVASGVEESRILMEDRSTSTVENFEFSREIILDALGPDASIAFVTTRFHVYRAALVARKLGIEAAGAGAEDVWYSALNNYLRESLAVAAYRVLGRI